MLDEGKNKSYGLVPVDVYVKPGQRVQLKGQKTKNDAGDPVFKAKNLLKDLGTCDSPATKTPLRRAGNSVSRQRQASILRSLILKSEGWC